MVRLNVACDRSPLFDLAARGKNNSASERNRGSTLDTGDFLWHGKRGVNVGI